MIHNKVVWWCSSKSYFLYCFQVIEVTLRAPQAQPVVENGHQTAADILAAMAPQAGNPLVDELAMLLHKPNMKVTTPPFSRYSCSSSY